MILYMSLNIGGHGGQVGRRGVHTLTSVGIQALSTLSTIIGVLFENCHLVHHINCMKKRVFSISEIWWTWWTCRKAGGGHGGQSKKWWTYGPGLGKLELWRGSTLATMVTMIGTNMT